MVLLCSFKSCVVCTIAHCSINYTHPRIFILIEISRKSKKKVNLLMNNIRNSLLYCNHYWFSHSKTIRIHARAENASRAFRSQMEIFAHAINARIHPISVLNDEQNIRSIERVSHCTSLVVVVVTNVHCTPVVDQNHDFDPLNGSGQLFFYFCSCRHTRFTYADVLGTFIFSRNSGMLFASQLKRGFFCFHIKAHTF